MKAFHHGLLNDWIERFQAVDGFRLHSSQVPQKYRRSYKYTVCEYHRIAQLPRKSGFCLRQVSSRQCELFKYDAS